MRRIVVLALFSTFALSACKEETPQEPTVDVEEKKDPVKVKEEPKMTEADLPELAPDDPKTTVESNVVTSADYEEEAAETIAVENLEAELDRLEAEIVGE